MSQEQAETGGIRLRLHLRGRERMLHVPEQRIQQLRSIVHTVLREPFQRRTWSELLFFLVSGGIGGIGAAFAFATLGGGAILAVTFIGVVIIAGGLRGIRGIGAWHRALARNLLGERIADPEPFVSRPGFFGWLQSALRDRAAWRALAYVVVKIPIIIFGVWFGLSVWLGSAELILGRLVGGGNGAGFGFARGVLGGGYNSAGFFRNLVLLIFGLLLLLLAPWTMRLVVFVDRQVMRILLGPDALTSRVRTLEQSRAQTVDASVATLRRIERDLHDGTQAQLVALAMRLGQAKEKLAQGDDIDLDNVRRLIDEAHKGAKDAIVELRDLARGIHPPALDTGLEGALATLASRSSVPSDLTVAVQTRPTPAIEAIAYFCVAELLANVAQHAQASRASISCTQQGAWLRVVVRDDGRGGAMLTRLGSSSSGLAGLTDRVHAVDGRLALVSPPGGPTVVTVDLPCHA